MSKKFLGRKHFLGKKRKKSKPYHDWCHFVAYLEIRTMHFISLRYDN